jgi:hypothetical protein
MASQKHNLLGFLHGGSKKKDKGANPLNQPPGAAGPPDIQARASTSKQSTTERFMDKLGGPFSRPKTPSTQPTTPTQPIPTTDQRHLRDETTNTPSTEKLISKQAEAFPESATATNHTKVQFLELGIGAIDLLSEVSDAAGLILPNPVGAVLGKVTMVLGTLKVCTTQNGGRLY